MIIKESREADKQGIYNVHMMAFDKSEAESVAKLAIALLEDETAIPLLSLIAVIDEQIAGHVLYTKVTIENASYEGGYILAPLAVMPAFQNQGVGKALIQTGLDILKQRDANFVLVLGDPEYYTRRGFSACHRLKPPYSLTYPEAWMVQELKAEKPGSREGMVTCAASLQPREYW